MEGLSTAMTNRSLRTIQNELDFLTDTSTITPAQRASILSHLPPPTTTLSPPSQTPFTQPPLTEKQPPSFYAPPPAPSPAPPPPAYASTPNPHPASLATATALYAYTPTDAGDLALQPHDRVLVTEWMNADWAKGRNERSGGEGIFPRSYVTVTVLDEKAAAGVGYGNGTGNGMVEGEQGGGAGAGGGKLNEQGKKFGKKMGNAAIFGAGATIGSNLVNSIF